MITLLDDFFREIYKFNRPFKEVEGYVSQHNEDGTDTLCFNALGVNPDDITIDVQREYPERQYLMVSGKTKDDVLESEYSVNFTVAVRKPIKKIIKSFRSGLLILKLEYDKPSQPKIEIVDSTKLLKD